jgi:hypothetical protein
MYNLESSYIGGCTTEVKLLAFFPSETGSGKHDIDKLELLGKAEVSELPSCVLSSSVNCLTLTSG